MRCYASLAIVAALPLLAATAPTCAADAPLMGGGSLAVVYADDDRADLADISTASFEDGALYFDHHVRRRDFAGDPPKRGILARQVVNCREWRIGQTSWYLVNYHTGDRGEPLSSEADMKPLDHQVFQADLCRLLLNGATVREALTHEHDDAMARFPRFALSVPDGLRPARIENGKIVEMEETELLQHLRRVNPNF